MANTPVETGYAPVNGLDIYYEIHGTGRPLVLLHGAYMTISLMGGLVPALAENRRVIAVELQGHGRTADVADRPLTYEGMADDVAALIGHLGIEEADIFGYSMGGGVALQFAIRHPGLVRKLVSASATYRSEGVYLEVLQGIEHITPEAFTGTPWREEYDKLAPNPEDFPTLVAKLKELDAEIQAWPPEDIRSIGAPTLLVIGDSDIVRPEHAVEMFRLLGGGVAGDLAGLPTSQLAVLPGTTHVGLVERADWLVPMIGGFLDAPGPEGQGGDVG